MARKLVKSATTAGVIATLAMVANTALAGMVGPNYPKVIGKGEGVLNIVAWEGYAQDEWVKPFEKQTGCKVNRKYAGSSDEMVALMRQGGGATFDLVSASGDASLRLIYGGDVQPIDVSLIPDFKNFLDELKSPPHNTVNGLHYGLSYEWGPNVLLWNTEKVAPAPTSWAALYDPRYKGKITVPDNPIQIADAALYLSVTQPALGITDPYELTEAQLDATVVLLKKQRLLVKKYWTLASDEIELFRNGDVVIGAAWPYQTITLKADGVPVADMIPVEGATGWADSWMLSAKSSHVNCAYKWMAYVSTPKVQAQQAIYFGETPANAKACPVMDKLEPGSCVKYRLNKATTYLKKIKFWKTPQKACGNGEKTCTSYMAWQRKWQEIKG